MLLSLSLSLPATTHTRGRCYELGERETGIADLLPNREEGGVGRYRGKWKKDIAKNWIHEGECNGFMTAAAVLEFDGPTFI